MEKKILDYPSTENLDYLFKPLSSSDALLMEMSREKARVFDRIYPPSWLRVYAIRLEKNVYVITGGAIKLTRTMQERSHTLEQLEMMNKCKDFLLANKVFDADSFIAFSEEENL